MMKIVPFILVCFLSIPVFGQITDNQINTVAKTLSANGKSKQDIENVVNGIITSPDLYNTFWKNFIDQVFHNDSATGMFLKDLNLRFKAFETTNNPAASLGFTYDFNFDYANFRETNKGRISNTFGLTTKGNVAFKKELNPVDFLVTNVHYSFSRYKGGVVKASNDSLFAELNRIEDTLAVMKDMQSPAAIALWEEFGRNLGLSNQYYYAFSPKFAFESNQDFSLTQFVPGLTIDLGLKAWNNKAKLARYNVFDYPFALLRLLTGTDKTFTPYGSTIPILQFSFDYVLPSNDSVRKNLTGNLNPFPRFSFETGFRTFIRKIGKESIFFNANYRYFREINAPKAITEANLNYQSYFIMTLQSSSGFYVSYANGKLPFDLKNNQTYSIGFNYKLN